jgi:hypothetical protein
LPGSIELYAPLGLLEWYMLVTRNNIAAFDCVDGLEKATNRRVIYQLFFNSRPITFVTILKGLEKDRKSRDNVPVIVVTGNAIGDQITTLLQAGMVSSLVLYQRISGQLNQ